MDSLIRIYSYEVSYGPLDLKYFLILSVKWTKINELGQPMQQEPEVPVPVPTNKIKGLAFF